MFIGFFIGQYWFVFTVTIYQYSDGNDPYFADNENWNIADKDDTLKNVIGMYFAFTTISTIGFGDFYPITDTERAVWAPILLSGVAVFSYFMGYLLEMIMKVKDLGQEFNKEEDLERFFAFLRKFNRGMPIN